MYFIDNNEHYISMQELHDNLWQGRIVSDTAVRRIVSKLRILFGDDHKNPNYIKSLPKKGYKLICKVQTKQSESNNQQNNNLIDNTANEQQQAKHRNQLNPQINIVTKKKRIFAMISVLIILFISTVIYYQNVTIKPKKLLIEKIKSLPGNKLAIAQSLDKQYLAFSGEIDEYTGNQIYLKKSDKQGFEPITKKTHLPVGLVFSSDKHFLLYADLKKGNSSIKQIDITNKNYKTLTIVDGFYLIADVFISNDKNIIYFSALKSSESPGFIYQYNFKTQQIIQFTSSSQASTLDVSGELSPNGEHMLVLQREKFSKKNSFRIINMKTNNIEFRYQQNVGIYDVKWLDNKRVLFIDDNKIIKFNIKKNSKALIADKNPYLENFSIINKTQFLAIQSQAIPKLFLEKKLPFNYWSTNQVFNINNNISDLNYFTNKTYKLAVVYKNSNTILAKLNVVDNAVIPLITTKYPINIIAAKGNKVLVNINSQVAVFDMLSNHLEYLTSGDDFVGDATFSHNEESILFSVRDYQGWKIKRYDMKEKTYSLLLKKFRYIRPYFNDFVIADDKGEMYFFNNKTKKSIKLNYQLSDEPDTCWYVVEPYIYWSSHDLVNVTFHQLNLLDVTLPIVETKIFDYNKVRADFSINSEGSSLIYSQRTRATGEIVQVSFTK
ncbi:MAG: winged helix-turn-helix domain-containing protein [Alteromonadaceae bacterium]|nr:winged helix-turn-helix domain-containing protein [Alteromonadaceae bacterium]